MTQPTYEELKQRVEALEEELTLFKKHSELKYGDPRYLWAFIHNTNLPVYLKDADYRYIFINKQFEKIAHVTHDKVTGKDDFDIFTQPIAKLFRSQDKEVVQRREVMEFEETIILPDGIQTFLTAKFPLKDQEGNIYAVGGVCTDISLRKVAEAELKEAEEKYRSIFDHSPLGIFHINTEGVVTASNKKLAEILGLNIAKIVGFDLKQFTEEEDIHSAIISVLSGNVEHREGEFQFGNTGACRDLRVVFSPTFALDGSIAGAIGIVEDITIRKNVEKALKEGHNTLELQVHERTAELAHKTEKLMETNYALKVLLEKRDLDKKEIEENILFNVEKLILPFMEKLRLTQNAANQQSLIDTINSNLETITSSFSHKHKSHLSQLTPAQIQIAGLIKQGHTTKEIASILNLSPSTISCHRQEIRKRLALTNNKINLQTVLAIDLK